MTQHTPDPRWAQSLGDGAAGAALLALEQQQDCRDWLRTMVAEPVLAHPNQVGLFDGAPAVAFTFTAAGNSRALPKLDGHIDEITRTRLDTAHQRIDRGEPPAKREFDLISGLTGLAVYLLRRDGDGDGNLLRDVLAYLVRLTLPQPGGLPGWWTIDGPTGPASEWRGGHGNLGIAHGISGPLALLSLAMRRGVTVNGQPDAIDRICRWLDRWRCETGSHTWWPGAISHAEHSTGTVRQRGPQRPSWCYGTPGITRAQQVAGLALEDPRRQRVAAQALAACLSDEEQLAQLTDVAICHGWAGLLHTAWRVGEHDEQVCAYVPQLLGRLTDRLSAHPPPGHGLLDGLAGARLAQRAATTNTSPITQWDACLLLD